MYLVLVMPQPEAPVVDPLGLVALDHQLGHGDGGRHQENQGDLAALQIQGVSEL